MRPDGADTKRFRLPTQDLVYCYRRTDGRIQYLMLRRMAKLGGFWQGITGAPEGEETLLAAASRELSEETRLTPWSIRQVDFSYCFPVEEIWKWAYHPEVTSIVEHVFLTEVAEDAEPELSFEHDSFEWASFNRGMHLLKYDNNRKALEYCNQLLPDTG